ncbi:MAG: hypothetical protein N4J56_001782 [Chroococcidiopsis sp. SAG 2025]|uniref:hypothetical protein n=1 Tax=Chroococcidiopsis sp. SAG 2025 TaxID=171389 RepID=UPI002936F72C|nr:hypothetical protein [Chroococcidiopsis sp. SAG 2025]MDV2992128.1 hypothetical protein [Chroococcidiopsis sp. SAG 2025]
MFAVFLFVVVFSFYCWLFYPTEKRHPKGWDVVEPDTSWIGWCCTLPAVNELMKRNIRQLKKLASKKHIHGYGNMTKSQLIEVLAA